MQTTCDFNNDIVTQIKSLDNITHIMHHNTAHARKYCIKASASVRNRVTGRVVSSVVAYDKSPDIGAIVEKLCADRAMLDSDSLETTPVVVTFYEDCPAECHITVNEADASNEASNEASSTEAS